MKLPSKIVQILTND